MTEREFWNDAYQQDPTHTVVPDRFIGSLIEGIPRGSALDIGCGSGENTIFLARNGWDVTGVDWSDHAVFLAERAAFRVGVNARFEVADIAKWNPRQTFDLVTITYALPVGGQAATVLRNAVRALNPGGTLFVAEWDRSMADAWGFDPCELHAPEAIVTIIPELTVQRAEVQVVNDMFAHDDPRAFHGRWARVAVVHAIRQSTVGNR